MSKIVHFGKYYLPDSGGIESVTASLAKGAAAEGYEVTVVCFQKTLGTQDVVIDGVRVVRASIDALVASQPLSLKYFTKCLLAAHGANIVHLHAPNMLGALCALLIGKTPRLLVHWHSDVINKGWLARLTRPLEKALLRRADSIVATSQVYADFSEALRPFSKKITIVPIGVPDVTHAKFDQVLPQSLEVKVKGRKIILAVGRLVPYKGFDVLIEAAKALTDDVVVIIVGGGPLENELMKAIAVAKVDDRVLLTGRLSDAALHSLFTRAKLYCLPSTSRAEAFGVVLLEAMSYGLPIVATEIPGSGVQWVNQHGITGLNVPTRDPVCLAKVCNQILGEPALQRQYAMGARQRFINKFTEKKSVTRVLNIYNLLMTNEMLN